MVLCRKCAHVVGPATLRCPRCHWRFPYLRSRRWRPQVSLAAPTVGKACPRCLHRTTRQRSPLSVKVLRLLTLHRCSYRACVACGWSGTAFHRRGTGSHRRRPQEA